MGWGRGFTVRVPALRVQGLTSNGVTLQGFGLRVLGLGRFFWGVLVRISSL